ncbi:MAG TPA: hypothetical protein VFY29_21170 [Terriglobia bacterium]|nr:hypothetical protein [Terriglobia bacterium]
MKRLRMLGTAVLLGAALQAGAAGRQSTSASGVAPSPAGMITAAIPVSAMIWDASRQRLVATTASSDDSRYFVVVINPETGIAEQTIPLEERPAKLAISDDGVYLYVGLDRRQAVLRYRMLDRVRDLEIGLDPGTDRPVTRAISVLPGRRESIVVATSKSVTVYDGDVPRRETITGKAISRFYVRSSDRQLIAFGDYQVFALDVNASGIRVTRAARAFQDGKRESIGIGGRFVVNSVGDVFDLDKGVLTGRLALGSGTLTPSATPIVDPSGVVYMVTAESSSLVLTRYSTETFRPTASLPLKMYSNDFTAVAWNGGIAVAGRSLVLTRPGALTEVSATRLPQPIIDTTGVIRIPLKNNAMVYSPQKGTLYAAVAGSTGTYGNSIVPLNPSTGTPGAPLFVGSEPAVLAVSEDGERLFAGLKSVPQVSQVNLGTSRVEYAFSIADGASPSAGNGAQIDWRAMGMVGAPGEPQAVVVLRGDSRVGHDERAVTVYDRGAPRPNMVSSSRLPVVALPATSSPARFTSPVSRISRGDVPNTVLASVSTGPAYRLRIDRSGARIESQLPRVEFGSSTPSSEFNAAFFNSRLADRAGFPNANQLGESAPAAPAIDQGRLFASDGRVWTADRNRLLGSLYVGGFPLPDAGSDRVFYVQGALVVGFDVKTLRLVSIGDTGLRSPNGRRLTVLDAIWMEGKTIAVRTEDEIALFPLAAMKPLPAPSETGEEVIPGVRRMRLSVNDLVVDSDGSLLATASGHMGALGNSVLRINPRTGQVESVIDIGSEPRRLVIARDGVAYTWLSGEALIAQIDLKTGRRVKTFSPAAMAAPITRQASPTGAEPLQYRILDMAADRRTGVLAVHYRRSANNIETALFDDGKQRSATIEGGIEGDRLAFDESGGILYQYEAGHVKRLLVTSDGLKLLSNSSIPASPGTPAAQDSRKLLYFLNRDMITAIDPENSRAAGRFIMSGSSSSAVSGDAGQPILPDPETGRLFAVLGRNVAMFDLKTYDFLGALLLPPYNNGNASDIAVAPGSLVKWDADGLAFRTKLGEVYTVRISSIPLGGPTVTPPVLGSSSIFNPSAPPRPQFVRPQPNLPEPNPQALLPTARTRVRPALEESSPSLQPNSTPPVFSLGRGPEPPDGNPAAQPDSPAPAFDPNPSLTRPPVESPAATAPQPKTSAASSGVRVVDLEASGLVFDRKRGLLYASVPQREGARGDTIATIDPAMAAVVGSVFGGAAKRTRISEDSRFLYVLTPTGLQRLDLALGFVVHIGDAGTLGFAPMPGTPRSVAVSTAKNITIYDDATARKRKVSLDRMCDGLAFGSSSGRLYCHGTDTNRGALTRLTVNGDGVSLVDTSASDLLGSATDMWFYNGLLYANTGHIVDAEKMIEKPRLPINGPGQMAVDDKYIYWLSWSPSANEPTGSISLRIFERQTLELALKREIRIGPYVNGSGALTPCGSGCVAFQNGREIYLVDVP